MQDDKWTMHGVEESDPRCIKTAEELKRFIQNVGFLPLFRNEVSGFSVEENVSGSDWWTDDPEKDPWLWRTVLCSERTIAYGKFFCGKAGFVSSDWFGPFACIRRNGYDFDSLCDEGLAKHSEAQIMRLFCENGTPSSPEIKLLSGIKNPEPVISSLQQQCYLITSDFRQRINKQGLPYGWHVSVYCTPEEKWGSDFAATSYELGPQECKIRILKKLRTLYPEAAAISICRLLFDN